MKYYSKTQHLNTSHTTPHISVPRTIIRQLLHKKFNVCNVMADDGSHAILKCCVCNNSFLFKVLEYNEMNQNNKKTISVHSSLSSVRDCWRPCSASATFVLVVQELLVRLRFYYSSKCTCTILTWLALSIN